MTRYVSGAVRDLPSAHRSTTPALGSVALAATPLLRRLAIVVLATVALIATLLSAPVHADAKSRLIIPATPVRTAVERTIATAVLVELNVERAVHGLAPLRMNSDLMLAARRHDVLMARMNEMSHQLRKEPVFTSRFQQAGYKWQWAGENVAWNSQMTLPGVLFLQKLMYNERAPDNGHRLNILNSHYRDVGVDILFDVAHHKIWLTTDFGRR